MSSDGVRQKMEKRGVAAETRVTAQAPPPPTWATWVWEIFLLTILGIINFKALVLFLLTKEKVD
jgi:hypothetical protein